MNDWGRVLDFGGVPWSERMLQASWQGALVMAAAWAIARWCTFLSPRVICWVWRLACLKLVVAFLCVPPIGLPLLPAKPETTMPAEPDRAHEAAVQTLAQEPPSRERPLFVGQNGPRPHAADYPIPGFPWWQLLWLAGAGGSVAITLAQWKSVRTLCGEARPSQRADLAQFLRREADRLRVRRAPELRISSDADGPLLAGIRRPTIVLPDRVEESLDQSELQLILAHELAHLKRRDLLWNWLPTIVGWLFWFHPLVWLMKRSWAEAQEAACDELLIQRRAARPVEYGRLLLKLAMRRPRPSNTSLVAAGMFGPARNLERRIFAMARVRPFSRGRLLIAVAVLSLLAVCGLVPWRLVAQQPDRPVPPPNPPASSTPPQAAAKAHTGVRFAQTGTFSGTFSGDGKGVVAWSSSTSVAEQLPGKIYTWAGLELEPQAGKSSAYNGPVAIDPNTGKWEKLNIDGASLRVSPTGNLIAFCRYHLADAKAGHTESEPFYSDLTGGLPVRIAESGFGQLWSPDGKRLLYHINNKTKASEDVGFRGTVWIYDLATKQATKIPVPETDEADDWSLSGNWLVTVSDRHPPFGHGYQLYVMHPDGTEQRRLTEGKGLNCYPRFQPGTNRVAYHHQAHNSDSLWLVDFDGSNRKQLLASDSEGRGAPNGAGWSPDGKWLAVTRFDWEFRDVGTGATKKREFFRSGAATKDRIEIIAPNGTSRGVLKLDHVVHASFLAQPDWH